MKSKLLDAIESWWHVLFLIAAGYVLNAALRLHTPNLWIRCVAFLLLGMTLWKAVRFRRALIAIGFALYVVSLFNPYRTARVTAYVQQHYQWASPK